MNLQTLPYGSQICVEDPGEPSTGEKRISVTEQEAALLAVLARGLLVLEIGTGLGNSTRALASSADHVTTLDIDPWVHTNVWPSLPDEVVKMSTRRVLEITGRFDMVFIDGDHSFTSVKTDLAFARQICKRGIIVMHDWKIPDVRAALDDTWALIDTHHGIAVKSVGY